jgi:selT/selW/selH-like putative selenoprotein
LANHIRRFAPNVVIEHGNYPPGPFKEFVGNILSLGFYAALALAVGLGNAFLPAQVTQYIQGNRGMVIAAGFFCNMIAGSLLQTGAFEVYVDGRLVFSKLQSGGLPNPEDIIAALRSS